MKIIYETDIHMFQVAPYQKISDQERVGQHTRLLVSEHQYLQPAA
jgi:hypothetical protein